MLSFFVSGAVRVVQDLRGSKTFWLCVVALAGVLLEYLRGEINGHQALSAAGVALLGIFLKHGQVTSSPGFGYLTQTTPLPMKPASPLLHPVLESILVELGIDPKPVLAALVNVLRVDPTAMSDDDPMPPAFRAELVKLGVDADKVKLAHEEWDRRNHPVGGPPVVPGPNDRPDERPGL